MSEVISVNPAFESQELPAALPLGAELDIARACVSSGIAVVDETCRLIVANRTARRMIVDRDGLEVVKGALHVVHPDYDDLLQDLVRKVARQDPPPTANIVGVPSRKNAGFRFAVKVVSPGGSVLNVPDPRLLGMSVAILIIADLNGRPVDVEILATLFDLTDREAEAAHLFSAGLESREIADKMGVRDHTVPDYLRNAYLKMGCENQIEMVRMLVPFLRREKYCPSASEPFEGSGH